MWVCKSGQTVIYHRPECGSVSLGKQVLQPLVGGEQAPHQHDDAQDVSRQQLGGIAAGEKW